MWLLFFFFVVFLILVLRYFLLSSSSSSENYVSEESVPSGTGSVISLEEKYDVFISFRGEDTRNGFTSHLYAALSQKQIATYIDNDLTKGGEISKELLKAIEDSKISIVIFSKDYASSSWCLDELAHMLECKKQNPKYVVVPIFYCIDPSDVRRQKGGYKASFSKLEKRFKHQKDKVKSWRNDLKEAASLSGFHYSQTRTESELIKEIVEAILQKLNNLSPNELKLKLYKGLVGIEKQIEEVESMLRVDSKDDHAVHIVGIWGMGGIGKTSLASVLFNKLSSQFEGACFLANVREEWDKFGPNHLRDKLFSNLLEESNLNLGGNEPKSAIKLRLERKKVLIVLDDVNSSTQVEFLLVDQFASGSRIIITTRNKQVLRNEADEIYEVKALNLDDSLKLFKSHAFKRRKNYNKNMISDSIDDDFDELSNKVVNYANGVPLAIKILGCFLHNRSKEEWESTLKKLKTVPNKDIESVLKISYDGLDDSDRNIFLDIACFFKGSDKDDVTRILDGCGFSASIGLSVLTDMSLISIDYHNIIWMHDMIQEMGWHIVQNESDIEPGRRSRLWVAEDVYHVFKNNTGTETIQGIFLDSSKIKRINLSPAVFSRMYNLRLLKIYNSKSDTKDKIFLPKGLECLPDKLRYLYWVKYPLKFLPSNFALGNLVELWLPDSHIEQLREEDVNKSYLSEDEDEDDDEEEYKLVKLDVENCKDLKSIPVDSYKMKYLLYCNLGGCSSIYKLPEFPRHIKELILSGTAIQFLPSSIQNMSSVEYLYLDNCESLENLPSSFKLLTKLQELYLRNCKRIKNLPELPSILRRVHAEGCTSLEIVPSSSACVNQDWDRYVASRYKDNLAIEGFQFFNCGKLDQSSYDNILDDALLRFVRAATAKLSNLHYNPTMGVSISSCYPGKEIPSLLNHQKEGSSITMMLPPKWCNEKCLGFAICSVFELVSESDFRIQFELIFRSGYWKSETFTFEEPETISKSSSSHVYVSYRTVRLLNTTISCCSMDTVTLNFCPKPILDVGEKLGEQNRAKVKKCGITLIYAPDISTNVTKCPIIGFQPT